LFVAPFDNRIEVLWMPSVARLLKENKKGTPFLRLTSPNSVQEENRVNEALK